MRKVTPVLVSVLFSLTCFAQSGPFGFQKGMSRSQIIAVVGQKNVDPRTLRGGELLSVRMAPKPDPQFAGYMLLAPPAEGLIRVAAIGKNMPTNDSGTELRAAYQAVVEELTKKFGPPTHSTDACNGPAMLCKRPDNWMMTMYGKQRKLASAWLPDKPTQAMRDAGIELISVEASASSMNSGFVSCDFELEGFEKYAASKGQKRPKELNPADATATGQQKPGDAAPGEPQKPVNSAASGEQKPAEPKPSGEPKPPDKKQ